MTPISQLVAVTTPINCSANTTMPFCQSVNMTTPICQSVNMTTPLHQPVHVIASVYRPFSMTTLKQSVKTIRDVILVLGKVYQLHDTQCLSKMSFDFRLKPL